MEDKLKKLAELLEGVKNNDLCTCKLFESYAQCKGCPADSEETKQETIALLRKLLSK